MSISPPTTTTTTTTTATATATAAADDASPGNTITFHRQTYWCHECDMSVILLCPRSPTTPSSPFPPLCPHCRHDFLEQMESFTPPHNPSNSSPDSTVFYQTFSSTDPSNPFPVPSIAPTDDTFLLDSPYFHRLINHLTTTTNDNGPTQTNPPQCNSRASKSAIESLQRITVDSAFLQKDPTIVCPVCKDQFSIDSEAKVLPCKHTYHAECIIPWLEMNNSCPVCRYKLPSQYDEKKNEVQGRENFIEAARLNELLDDEHDLFGFRSTLRNVVRRHQQNGNDSEEHNRNVENWNRRVVWDNEVLFSPTQIGEAESGGGGRTGDHLERANSVETVSSWPRLPVDGGASGSGSRNGDGDVGVSTGRGIDKGDALTS